MQLPEELQRLSETFFEGVSALELKKAREALTRHYKTGGVSPFHSRPELLAYLGARMPATFAAVCQVLKQVSLQGHVLDLGAGLASASWAAIHLFPTLEKITLIEQSAEAIKLGKQLFLFERASWIQQSLSAPLPKADAAILSYVIGELSEKTKILTACWEAVDTLILIEPGTPKAFQSMKEIRKQLLSLGAHILAPCPHAYECPSDWCHFAARLERTRLHRLLKEGTLGYEDEKFCYLIASKKPTPKSVCRIVRHPLKQSGHVQLTLCTDQGKLIEKTISRKQKNLYKSARDSNWGDSLLIE